MLAICPYPDCQNIYEVVPGEVFPGEVGTGEAGKGEAGKGLETPRVSQCPACNRESAFRCFNIWRRLKAKQAAREGEVQERESSESVNGAARVSAIIEDVRSLFNVGSIFRTADATGLARLYLCGITGCPPSKEISKTSLGAENHVNWQYVIHPLEIIPLLKTKGVTIIGLERTPSSVSLVDALKHSTEFERICFVVGNEVTGVSPEVLASCDHVCHLPMKGHKESLNVAVAFGVAAYLISLKV
jgi:tRNA G18 (ribose-2'-O)-methylase SpoU